MKDQCDALEWLQERGQTTLQFLTSKGSAATELVAIGRQTLSRLNMREDAFQYLYEFILHQ